MSAFFFSRRTVVLLSLALSCLTLLCSCATSQPVRSHVAYRLIWTATRASDQALLISSSLVISPGQTATVRTDSIRPTEDKPAFPSFTAGLSPTKTVGTFELVTRARLRETSRNKKGKIRLRKRNIGALVPIRAGETQVVSSGDDPIHLDVRLVRK